jgi:hypothetical protein
MQAYRFETRISKSGLIQIPLTNQLYDKDVEIIILPKQKQKSSKLTPIDFINKWSGFLSNLDIENSKYQYLTEKYK